MWTGSRLTYNRKLFGIQYTSTWCRKSNLEATIYSLQRHNAKISKYQPGWWVCMGMKRSFQVMWYRWALQIRGASCRSNDFVLKKLKSEPKMMTRVRTRILQYCCFFLVSCSRLFGSQCQGQMIMKEKIKRLNQRMKGENLDRVYGCINRLLELCSL